jgi:tRNA-Thr(GGU) m(6)t(6)A37 methyltransferase TsaA
MEDKADSMGKLLILMQYWLSHNSEHLKENVKWRDKAKEAGFHEVAHCIESVIGLSKEINVHIESAIKSLGADLSESKAESRKGEEHHEHAVSVGHKHIEFHQIGTIRTPYKDRAPHYPEEDAAGEFRIIVNEEYTDGLDGLDAFGYVYVLSYLDRTSHHSPLRVSPPGAQGKQVGIFASRSPDRPNPIGLSVVRVKEIKGNVVTISGIDVLDNTPLIDVKPYMRKSDVKMDAGDGWAGN